MELTDTYKKLNKGEQININDITEVHWKNFDKEIFYKTAFKAKNDYISKYCSMNVIINHFSDQIILGVPYLNNVLKKAQEDGASPEQIKTIKEVHDEIHGYWLTIPKTSNGN